MMHFLLFPKIINKKRLESGVFMRATGLEPARRRHQNLNLARLPIPPCPRNIYIIHFNKMMITYMIRKKHLYLYRCK